MSKHIDNLRKLFPNAIYSDRELAQQLRYLESAAHELAEDECNRPLELGEAAARKTEIEEKLAKVLGEHSVPVFLNGDPRGYALKIDDQWMRDNKAELETDWGGYGLLAPEWFENDVD